MRHIISDPNFLRGKPYLGGFRLSVEMIIDEVVAKKNTRDVAKKFPQLTEEDVLFCLQYAAKVVNNHPEDADVQREERQQEE
ncbi:MAG: DUF433 domain-containing protein, partial [Candidatus Sericytochromatia bacterium]